MLYFESRSLQILLLLVWYKGVGGRGAVTKEMGAGWVTKEMGGGEGSDYFSCLTPVSGGVMLTYLPCYVYGVQVACMQFVNIVVHSVENMNFRVHLQHEFTQAGLDDYLEVCLLLPLSFSSL